MKRRCFLRTGAIMGAGMTAVSPLFSQPDTPNGLRVGIIGLDTSHCIAFTKALNAVDAGQTFLGYKVVAAYPTQGSSDLPVSIDRLAGFTGQIRAMGIEITDSIEALLEKVDVILLETVDGRKHLEQALPVLRAGKRMFIDKPIAASLADAMAIFNAAKHYNVPVFSSSSLRYINGMEEIKNGSVGKVLGAETFSPAKLEKTLPDLFWYGIHGVEMLFAAMGSGCKSVVRAFTPDTDVVVGIWKDNRIGSFRGIRAGKAGYGGTVFGEKDPRTLGPYGGYKSLLVEITRFFKTGIVPVKPEETLNLLAFMEAADESKIKGGVPVEIQTIMERAKSK